MPQISKTVRDAIKAQLSAGGTGFNDRLVAIAPVYDVELWQIDWSNVSTNFFFGRVNPAQFEESGAFTYPLVTIDTIRSQHTNRIKFATFAGPVIGVIDVHHSWHDSSVMADFASWVDATEDAVIGCLNDQNAQFWPGNLLWNGQIVTNRGPILAGGYSWLQSISFVCNFELLA